MKTSIFLVATILFAATLFANVPEKMSYQAVVRNTKGALITNQNVGMQISIYFYITKSEIKNVYVETQSTTTNENGLLSIEIGAGTVVEGVFANIDWGARNYYIKTEIDPGGKTSYSITSDAQLLSVPYALHAKSAESFSETDPTWKGPADTLSAIGRKGNVGIGTTLPSALLHVHGKNTGGGNVLFTGEFKDIEWGRNPGNPPASGEGTRMMWYPDKAAFRAGYVLDKEWDKDSIGIYSIALGYSSKAKGNYSFASGSGTASGIGSTAMGNGTASGIESIAIGSRATASGIYSTAIGKGSTALGAATSIGFETKALGIGSTAIGGQTTAVGQNSTALGYNTSASSYCEFVIGRNNTIIKPISATTWNVNDRLFVVGNGIDYEKPQNAFVILKNGKTGIGTDTPAELLHVANATGAARMQISSSATSNADIRFYAGDTYKGAIGYDNTKSYLYIQENGLITFKNGAGTATAWNTTSDGRLKTNRQTLPYGLNEVLKLEPVKYFLHNSTVEGAEIIIGAGGGESMGFVAQDVYKIIPEAVQPPTDENKELWSIDYQKLTPVLVKALQEQQQQINELKEEIKLLKERK